MSADAASVGWDIAEALAALTEMLPGAAGTLVRDGSGPAWQVLEKRLVDALNRVDHVRQLLGYLGGLTEYLESSVVEPCRTAVLRGESIAEWVLSCKAGLLEIEALIAWEANKASRTGRLAAVLTALEDFEASAHSARVDDGSKATGERWAAFVRYSASLAWSQRIEQHAPILLSITADQREAKAAELGNLLEEKRKTESGTITERWRRRQIRHRHEPWQRVFQLRRSKYGEAKNLREAIQACFEVDPTTKSTMGLLDLRPCWLTNPPAASQLLPLVPGLFDVVIFDEASQCPIEEALPSVYRGKALIVSGDERQLPPTPFFSSRPEAQTDIDDTSAEEEVATDKPAVREEVSLLARLNESYLLTTEDLLQASIGRLPEEYLLVHYRSEHEALVQFSNHAFYGGRLEIPPSRQMLGAGNRPIEYIEVGGTYRERTNREEAKRVIEVLAGIWASPSERPTVGVVTFNRQQADLIQDLLDERRQKDPSFSAIYDQEIGHKLDEQDVGFFVKNLENVQGDERDIMVFSTTFGRDSEGRFFRRYGPIGASGGERRLNVAVTRAKRKVIVVTSMPLTEVAPALGSLSTGGAFTPAGYLQLYLAYARAVARGDAEEAKRLLHHLGDGRMPLVSSETTESPFEEEVRQAIEALGFDVQTQVGESGFRIDLAVVHPNAGRGYALGIECDGAAYHSDRSARLRDVWRQNVLEGRGWRIHRVWSTTWWYRREVELERLRVAIEDSIRAVDNRRCQLETEPPPVVSHNPSESGAEQLGETPAAETLRTASTLASSSPANGNASTKEVPRLAPPVAVLPRKVDVLRELRALEPSLDNLQCTSCRGRGRLAITKEGIVIECQRACVPARRLPVEMLQRLAAKLQPTCYSCGAAGLQSVSRNFGVLLWCRVCGSNNSWDAVSKRLKGGG